jgi:pimeloyl-ACP methyl ester carboxylesterase
MELVLSNAGLPLVVMREIGASLRAACWPLAGLQQLRPPVPTATTAKPPIVLVHGYLGKGVLLRPLAQRLHDEGYPTIAIVDYPSTRIGIGAIANRIASAVEQYKGQQVYLIGHSLGAVACRYYLKRLDGAAHVRHFVSLGGPHAGTRWFWMCPPKLQRILKPNGEVIQELSVGKEPVPTTVVRARYDHQVFPPERASLAEATEVLVHGHGHNGLLWAKEAHDAIVQALTDHEVLATNKS